LWLDVAAEPLASNHCHAALDCTLRCAAGHP
jgi:hypothetical protein